jgi:hypothetical protein
VRELSAASPDKSAKSLGSSIVMVAMLVATSRRMRMNIIDVAGMLYIWSALQTSRTKE